MSRDPIIELWRRFCDPENTCMDRVLIAHLIDEALRRG